ncbi:TonB-dependent receptor [Veillonella sp. DNF00869]|uniref:TonB-dependent receptor n=1 Tax=Veillonella sp. DNF00869 TaxID=1384081 RepID=UPI000781BACB|nr:TonB-dependent receptor [Veillonella sp. DNF00869]KXB88290.1 TonB-dependent receptor plug domain protein [Veillonella sp. DNF00869]
MKTKIGKAQLALLSMILSAMTSQAVQAVDTSAAEETVILPTVTVTATRTMEDVAKTPSSVSVVTQKDIEAKRVDTVADALQLLPGVYKSQVGNGGLQIRGFGSTNILVLLNGVPMNNTFNNGVDWEAIPVHTIDRIELVRGASSSLYGGRGVAGVISIQTKQVAPKESVRDIHWHGQIGHSSHGTWNNELGFDARVTDRVSVGVSAEQRRTGGFPGFFIVGGAYELEAGDKTITPDTPIPQTKDGDYLLGSRGDKAFNNKNLSVYATVKLRDKESLTYSYLYTNNTYVYKNPMSTITEKGKPVFAGIVKVNDNEGVELKTYRYLGYDGLREYHSHGLQYKNDANKIQASFNILDRKKDGFSSPNNPKTADYNGPGDDSFYPGKTINFDTQKIWEHIGKHTVVAGLNWKQESFDQTRRDLTNWRDHSSYDSTTYPDGVYEVNKGTTRNIALFLQDTYRPNDDWAVYTGLRVDQFKKFDGQHITYNEDKKQYDTVQHGEGKYTEWSPKVGVEHYVTDSLNIYASYGHSFNPPPLSQVYRYSGTVKANPDLNPEKSDTFEVGLKKSWDTKTTLGITGFYVNTKDKVKFVTYYKNKKVDYKMYSNVDSETRRGVELELRHQLSPKWSVFGNYTWQTGRVNHNAIPQTNAKAYEETNFDIPKHIIHAGVEYTSSKWNALFDTQYISRRQSVDEITGQYGSRDSYVISNLSVNYKLSKETTIQFGVQNVFDRIFFDDEATAGRTYSASMKFKF